MLEIGEKLPELSCVDQHNKLQNLKALVKSNGLIVFFYPKASTPGCKAEACNLNDNLLNFNSKGMGIVGVSADSIKRQFNFSEKNGFNYPLLADEEKEIINAFGVWGPKKFMGREYEGIHRTTFVFNQNAILTHRIDKVKTKTHSEQINELLNN